MLQLHILGYLPYLVWVKMQLYELALAVQYCQLAGSGPWGVGHLAHCAPRAAAACPPFLRSPMGRVRPARGGSDLRCQRTRCGTERSMCILVQLTGTPQQY